MKEYWIVKGCMSDDPDVLQSYKDKYGGDPKAGDAEWQFSDKPPGERGSSVDFPSLEAGLCALAPAIFHWVAAYDHKVNFQYHRIGYD